MKKAAIIYDLDNTIYPVSSIAGELFPPLYRLFEERGLSGPLLETVKDEMTRRPLQAVARDHGLSDELVKEATELLKKMKYTGTIRTFPDYPLVREIPGRRFLVTTGFTGLQQSKIDSMGIRNDFDQVYIVDPSIDSRTKKDVFAAIMREHEWEPRSMLVVGDDPESEIRAATELGIDTVLYDKRGVYGNDRATYVIDDYGELKKLFQE